MSQKPDIVDDINSAVPEYAERLTPWLFLYMAKAISGLLPELKDGLVTSAEKKWESSMQNHEEFLIFIKDYYPKIKNSLSKEVMSALLRLAAKANFENANWLKEHNITKKKKAGRSK